MNLISKSLESTAVINLIGMPKDNPRMLEILHFEIHKSLIKNNRTISFVRALRPEKILSSASMSWSLIRMPIIEELKL